MKRPQKLAVMLVPNPPYEICGLTTEIFREWNVPVPDPARYDHHGRVLLPSQYEPWLAGPENSLGSTALAVSSASDQLQPLRILSPLPGTVVYLDPDLPRRGSRLPLAANISAEHLTWFSDSLQIDSSSPAPLAILSEGQHQLAVQDERTGKRAVISFEVRAL